MVRLSTGRLSLRALFVLSVMTSALWGCGGSQFRLDRSAVKPRSDGAIRLSCSGNPRRFAVKATGSVYGLGDIQLTCLDQAACTEQRKTGPQTLKISQAGTWIEVSARQPGRSANSSGIVCLNNDSVLAGSCSEDDYVLDFIIDCPGAAAQAQADKAGSESPAGKAGAPAPASEQAAQKPSAAKP